MLNQELKTNALVKQLTHGATLEVLFFGPPPLGPVLRRQRLKEFGHRLHVFWDRALPRRDAGNLLFGQPKSVGDAGLRSSETAETG